MLTENLPTRENTMTTAFFKKSLIAAAVTGWLAAEMHRRWPARALVLTTLAMVLAAFPLALWQAHEVRRVLMAAHGLAEAAFEVVVIKVTGDQILDRALKDIGGKGLFTREIEEALLEGGVDIAVHSMKDMPTLQPEGLLLDCYLPREDVRDGFVSPLVATLTDLPLGAVVGSSSLRRRAQLAHRRPDLKLVEFRGNVQTRMRKLDEGVAEATFLAMAGLNRLGMAGVARGPIAVEEMLPAVATSCGIQASCRRPEGAEIDNPATSLPVSS